MAEQFDDTPSGAPDTGDAASRSDGRRGPSALLLVSGLVALVISGWAIVGPSSLAVLGTFDFRWVFVVVAIVVGVVLLAPHRRRHRDDAHNS